MDTWQIILIILLVVIAVLGILALVGRRLQGRVDSQQGLINANKQTMSIYVIDKKKMKLSESNLPQMVQDQIPKYLRWRKMPMVKAKVGPKITTLMCDDRLFKDLPVKKTLKVDLAGIYIVGVKAPKGKTSKVQEPAKKGWRERMQAKANEYNKEREANKKEKQKKKNKKKDNE